MANCDKLFQDGCREVEFGAPVSLGDEFNAKYMTFLATAVLFLHLRCSLSDQCVRLLSNERK